MPAAFDSTTDGTILSTYTRRFRPGTKLKLIVEIVSDYARVRRQLSREGVPQMLAALRAQPQQVEPITGTIEQQLVGVRLGRVVARVLGVLPADSRCLTRSLVLTSLLARRGIESSLVIGVKAEPEFSAHAWVETNGVALLPTHDSEFTRLAEL